MTDRTRTPKSRGYRWPAEWEPHAATWLSWPHKRDSWPGHFDNIPHVWADLVKILSASEPVHILAGGEAVMETAIKLVGHLPNVTLHEIPTNDAWMRDHGPIFLKNDANETAIVDWKYNAWGDKYPPYDLDDAVPRQIARMLGFEMYEPGIIMEGGSIETDGNGTLLTTAQCLLNPNRNPALSPSELEQFLRDYLGVEQVLWLGEYGDGSVAGDDTDAHIDQLARFVAPDTIVAVTENNPDDGNSDLLQRNLDQLRGFRNINGQPYRIVELPLPAPKYCEEERLPASYANFYIANSVVVVPTFDDPHDEIALNRLGQLFPTREVIGFPALELVWGLGAIHCISMQQPA